MASWIDSDPNNWTDLSSMHSIIGSLFKSWPETSEDWEEFILSDDLIEHYREHGYVSGIDLLTTEQIEMLLEDLDELMSNKSNNCTLWHEFHSNESTDKSKILFHALGAWRISPAFHDLLWSPQFLMAASQLLGSETKSKKSVRFWHDQLFCKPSLDGGVVAWHQDYSYWTRTVPMNHLTCWIGLDRATEETGCLQYVPGSHKWNLLPITGLAGDMDAIQNVLDPVQWEALQNPLPIQLQQVHGSFGNTSPTQQRRATVINVFEDGTLSASNDALLQGVPPVPIGEKICGKHFPLLYEPSVCYC